MKFLILNDLKYIFLKGVKWITVYLIVNLFVFPLSYVINGIELNNLLLVNIGLKFTSESLFSVLIYVLNITFYIYIYINIFFGNLKIGIDNVFLRIGKLKIVISKILTCFIFTLLMSIINFIFLNIIYGVIGLTMNYNLSYLVILVLSYMIKCMLVITILSSLLSKNKICLLVSLIYVAICFIDNRNLVNSYLFYDNIFLLVVMLILSIITYLIILSKTIISIFERSF